MKQLIVILGLFPALYQSHSLSSKACHEPENLESMFAMYEVKETLSIILPWPVQRSIENLKKMRLDKDEIPYVENGADHVISGDKSCPKTMSVTDSASLEERSTCPYYYVITHDPLRYPVNISEARCKCERCLDDSTGDNLCTPILFPKTVLRRGKKCMDGIYEYKPETYRIQNGCICAKRHFQSTSSQIFCGDQRSSIEEESHDSITGADGPDYESHSTMASTEEATTTLPFEHA